MNNPANVSIISYLNTSIDVKPNVLNGKQYEGNESIGCEPNNDANLNDDEAHGF